MDPHCHFCSKTESIDHLLFSCALAKLVWQVIICAFQLVRPPENTADLFGNWIKSFPKDQRHLVSWVSEERSELLAVRGCAALLRGWFGLVLLLFYFC
jgi:hypothetical protein